MVKYTTTREDKTGTRKIYIYDNGMLVLRFDCYDSGGNIQIHPMVDNRRTK